MQSSYEIADIPSLPGETLAARSSLNGYTVCISLLGLGLYALWYFLWGEKLLVKDGLGWDGVTYAAYATHFFHELMTTDDIYHVTRIFPSLIIYAFTQCFGLQLNTPHAVLIAFYILNSSFFLGVGYFWYCICRIKALDTTAYLLGFISLFINYACLKLAPFAPVFGDPCALFFGTVILYAYLKKKYATIYLLMVPLFFTWPLAVVLLMPLLIYPFPGRSESFAFRKTRYAWAVVIGYGLGCCTVLYALTMHQSWVANWYSLLFSWNQVWWPPRWHGFIMVVIVGVSMGIASTYLYCIAVESTRFKLINNSLKISWPHAWFFLGGILACTSLSFFLSHLSVNYTGKTIFSSTEFLALTAIGAIGKPALNLIMHITFLGPCAILWLLYMRPLMTAANQESFGLFLFILLTYLMALNPHSRQLTFNVPFMIYLLCQVFNQLMIKNKAKFIILYAAAALVGSKIYYLINVSPLQAGILSFPLRRFFMNFGLWTLWPGYFFNMGVMIIMGFLLWLGHRAIKADSK